MTDPKTPDARPDAPELWHCCDCQWEGEPMSPDQDPGFVSCPDCMADSGFVPGALSTCIGCADADTLRTMLEALTLERDQIMEGAGYLRARLEEAREEIASLRRINSSVEERRGAIVEEAQRNVAKARGDRDAALAALAEKDGAVGVLSRATARDQNEIIAMQGDLATERKARERIETELTEARGETAENAGLAQDLVESMSSERDAALAALAEKEAEALLKATREDRLAADIAHGDALARAEKAEAERDALRRQDDVSTALMQEEIEKSDALGEQLKALWYAVQDAFDQEIPEPAATDLTKAMHAAEIEDAPTPPADDSAAEEATDED